MVDKCQSPSELLNKFVVDWMWVSMVLLISELIWGCVVQWKLFELADTELPVIVAAPYDQILYWSK